jgi:hypothetical protein
VTSHIADIDVKHVRMSYAGTSIMSHCEYRWLCSCGEVGGWVRDARSARNGGARHVAAMEKR